MTHICTHIPRCAVQRYPRLICQNPPRHRGRLSVRNDVCYFCFFFVFYICLMSSPLTLPKKPSSLTKCANVHIDGWHLYITYHEVPLILSWCTSHFIMLYLSFYHGVPLILSWCTSHFIMLYLSFIVYHEDGNLIMPSMVNHSASSESSP